jgi:hypothetical protein
MTSHVETLIQTYLIDDLNWTFIFISAFVLFGVDSKQEFSFVKDYLKPKYRTWVIILIVIVLFTIFKALEGDLTISYFSELLRSSIITIILNSEISKRLLKKFTTSDTPPEK